MARRALTGQVGQEGWVTVGGDELGGGRQPVAPDAPVALAPERAVGQVDQHLGHERPSGACLELAERPVLEDAACGGHGRGGMGQVVGEHLVCVDAAEVDQRGGGRRHDALCEENSLRGSAEVGACGVRHGNESTRRRIFSPRP